MAIDAQADDARRRPRPRVVEKTRIEAFSDGVFAIVLTLLVLELLPGQHVTKVAELLGQWPFYLAYLTSFFTVAAVWISHHELFRRLRDADARLLVLNVFLLFSTSLVPWPTALIANALRAGSLSDRIAATAVYSLVTALLSLAWWLIGLYVGRHRHLFRGEAESRWARGHSRAALAAVVVALLSLPLAFVSAAASLVLLLVPPAFFITRLWLAHEDADWGPLASRSSGSAED